MLRRRLFFSLIPSLTIFAFSTENMPNPIIEGGGGLGLMIPFGSEALGTNPSRISAGGDEKFHIHLDLLQVSFPISVWDDWSPLASDMRHGSRSILSDSSFFDNLWKYDGVPIEGDAGFAVGAFCGPFAISGESHVVSGGVLEHGAVVPWLSLWDSVSYLIRVGISQKFGNWSVGQSLNFRGVVSYIDSVSVYNPEEYKTVFSDLRDSLLDAPSKAPHWRASYTIGTYRSWESGMEVSGAVREIGRESEGHTARPYVDLGTGWRWPQKNVWLWFPMQFLIGAQVDDIVGIDSKDAFLRRTRAGFECQQGFLGKVLETRASAGVQGGWLSAGLGLTLFNTFQFDMATWAEEAGRYVGQKENRHWVLRIRLGV